MAQLTCSAEGCDRSDDPHGMVKGMCRKHYSRMRKHGHLMAPSEMTLEERFWSYVPNREPAECWEWTGSLSLGYGIFTYRYEVQSAHRLSYTIHNGAIPEGMVVRHHCDNPPCVNTEHLAIGSQLDNMRDMVKRGRHTPSYRLVPSQVRLVRSLLSRGMPQTAIARYLGVSRSPIAGIAHRTSYVEVL